MNRRRDSTGIVLYNSYGGDIIPYLSQKTIDKIIDESNQDLNTNVNDSTELDFDLDKLKEDLINESRTAGVEYHLNKMTLLYKTKPGINKNITCVIKSIDTGNVAVPRNGCVISFGMDIPRSSYPRVGEEIDILFTTNVNDDVVFVNAVGGTPRLVRNGISKQEAISEGSHGRRFISKQLPRTAIGCDKFKNRVLLVVVEGTGLHEGCYGASLDELSSIMRKIGCYNAMNLDGGGSTAMVIGGKNLLRHQNPLSSRRLSVGIGAVRKVKK